MGQGTSGFGGEEKRAFSVDGASDLGCSREAMYHFSDEESPSTWMTAHAHTLDALA